MNVRCYAKMKTIGFQFFFVFTSNGRSSGINSDSSMNYDNQIDWPTIKFVPVNCTIIPFSVFFFCFKIFTYTKWTSQHAIFSFNCGFPIPYLYYFTSVGVLVVKDMAFYLDFVFNRATIDKLSHNVVYRVLVFIYFFWHIGGFLVFPVIST